jgi:hypothetical protein
MFDKELMFAENTALTAFESGVVGTPIDLGTPGAGRGREAFVSILCKEDAAATGSPSIAFALDSADNPEFTNAQSIPLSFGPLGKADLAKGKVLSAPLPHGIGRYVRLTAESSAELACAGVDAGIVLDIRE